MNITLFCGPSHEPFSPKSGVDGRGGSEEMVIGLSRELQKQGNTVTVFNRCSTDEGVYDGVSYINYEDAEDITTDILVIWRDPGMLLKYKLDKLNCKKYLWLHDTVMQLDVIPYLMGFDRIMVLSEWHKNYYTNLLSPEHHHKFYVTRNAIDYGDFKQKVERKPYKMVYGSLYNRGLEGLLTIWSRIKFAVPEATLSVFYGWETLEKLMPLEQFTEYKAYMENLLDQEGIEHLGRLSHKDVAKQYLEADVWAYPTGFNEVSCITAVKAQVGGAVPVVFPKAALHETVKYGVKVTLGNNMEELLDNYAKSLIRVLKDTKGKEAMRQAMTHYPDWSYKSLASEWTKEFNGR